MIEAKYGLPLEVRFCKKCVMSNCRPASSVEHKNTPDSKKVTLHIDSEGVCDACRVAEAKQSIDWVARETELFMLLDKHRSKTGAHDCIVPGSGGKDSYYAAHVLKHKYGMHPLLVTWAPHITTKWGVRNLERWQAIADHVMVTPNRSVHRLITRLAVERLLHPFQGFIIGQKNMAPKLAIQYGIPLVFFGEGESEYGNPKAEFGTAKRGVSYYSDTGGIHLGGASLHELRTTYGLMDCDIETYLPADRGMLDQFDVDVRYLGYYLRWHPQSAYYYAVEHGGFEPNPERTPGTWSKYSSVDDRCDDLHYFTSWIKFGLGRATYDAAQEIRSGDITREEGVALVHKFDGEYPERFEREVFEYLSVPGFEPMTREYFLALCDKFKSPHLWDGNKLRHVVEDI